MSDAPAATNRAIFAALSFAVACAAGILVLTGRSAYFARYLTGIDPVLAVAALAVIGAFALRALELCRWFTLEPRPSARVIATASALVALLAAATIAADIAVGFPRDINVPLPWSMLFYPAIAFVVEIVFHAVPVALLFALLAWGMPTAPDRVALICIGVVALAEPLFQMYVGAVQGSPPALNAYVGAHVFVFNLLQLVVFRRWGFLSMYGIRLLYYFLWHIVWGYLRLQMFF